MRVVAEMAFIETGAMSECVPGDDRMSGVGWGHSSSGIEPWLKRESYLYSVGIGRIALEMCAEDGSSLPVLFVVKLRVL